MFENVESFFFLSLITSDIQSGQATEKKNLLFYNTLLFHLTLNQFNTLVHHVTRSIIFSSS